MATDSHSIGELFERTIEQFTSIFDRLVYLASLRDAVSGAYRHVMFEKVLAPEQVDAMLRLAHQRVFLQWLELGLSQQFRDLSRYLGHETNADDDMVRQLRDRGAFHVLPPTEVERHERNLFFSDLDLVIRSILRD